MLEFFGIVLQVIGLITVIGFVAYSLSVLWDYLKTKKYYEGDAVKVCEPPTECQTIQYQVEDILEWLDAVEERLDILEEDINAALATKVSKKSK